MNESEKTMTTTAQTNDVQPNAQAYALDDRKNSRVITGDAKFDMYINALPSETRKRVMELRMCPRKSYQRYRKIGKAEFVKEIANAK